MKGLDVGTGIGDVAFLVAECVGPRGTVVGVDMNPAMLDVACQRAQAAGITNVAFIQGDLAQVALENQFDAVVGRLILLFIQDRAALLRRLSHRLRPDGQALYAGVRSWLKRWITMKWQPAEANQRPASCNMLESEVRARAAYAQRRYACS